MVFDRRITSRTPGTFRTKVITKGVDPQINCSYKASRIKQYFKEHRALRTETVICDTRDFRIGRRSPPRTGKPCGRLARPPTSVCATRKQPMPDPLPT